MDIQQFFDILQEGMNLRITKIHQQSFSIDTDILLHVFQRLFQRSAVCCINRVETDKALFFTAYHRQNNTADLRNDRWQVKSDI